MLCGSQDTNWLREVHSSACIEKIQVNLSTFWGEGWKIYFSELRFIIKPASIPYKSKGAISHLLKMCSIESSMNLRVQNVRRAGHSGVYVMKSSSLHHSMQRINS
jgi:hypothetical protein